MPAETSTTTPRTIRRLPTLIANQIAAGEVIERPASVVKELLDNAIDAGCRRINIHIEGGGVELIEISDDGCGIPADELPLALAPHATSKLNSAEQLACITTMGFRGEALASISSVARVYLRSRTNSDESAHCIDAEGDTHTEIRPEPGPVGTLVRVRNLFFNTPARRKFLRTTATEQNHCANIVRDLALAHPAIAFTLQVESKTMFDLPPDQGPRARALAVLGREMGLSSFEITSDNAPGGSPITLWGLAGHPELARPHTRHQHLFLNGRPIRDTTIQHALKEAYRGLIEPGKHPAALLLIDIDPAAVDVNVHPAKAEVRLRDSSLMHSSVLRAVRSALEKADLTRQVSSQHDHCSSAHGSHAQQPSGSSVRDSFSLEFKRSPASAQGRISDISAMRNAVKQQRAHEFRDPPAPITAEPIAADIVPAIQVYNSYIVTQDDDGLLIIDQHALHERIMFQSLLSRIERTGSLESQRLLTPSTLNASPARIEQLDALNWLLLPLGIEAQPMGPKSIAVHAFPTLLFERRVDPIEFLDELLDRAENERWNTLAGIDTQSSLREQALHEVLDMMACKAAIKAGDPLSATEIRTLLDTRLTTHRASNCPHGRPTTIRLTRAELERRFERR